MENTSVKRHEPSSTSSTKPTNIRHSNSSESNRINTTENNSSSFCTEIERIYSESLGKNLLPDTNLRSESELLRKFVSLHSPDCLLIKMRLHDFSISLLKQGLALGNEVKLHYQEWSFFDYLEAGHIPPYLFNFLGRSDLTLYDGCVIIKMVNCRHQIASTSKSDTSYPESCTYYFLLRPTSEIIAHQTNQMLLQSPDLHTQHPYTIRHRALQIESALTHKLAPPLCLDTSPDVLIAANSNQFQRFKYNHPRLKQLRRKFAKFNTHAKQTIKQTSNDLRLIDYLTNTAYIQGCRKPQKFSLLGSSMKECILLKSSTNLLSNIAISRPERALETAINNQSHRRASLSYSDQNDAQHFQSMSQVNFTPNKIAKSHSISLPNSYRPEFQSLLQGSKEIRRHSLENSRLYYSMNNSMHPDTISQIRSFSASTPGTPPVEPFTPFEEGRYPQLNPLETSHLTDSPSANLSFLHSQRNSLHTPSSMTSSDMHLRGNQQASIECGTDSGMNDVYFSRQNSHLSEQESLSKQLHTNLQSLPKFSNTFQPKIQPQNQFIPGTNKYSHKYFPGNQPNFPIGNALTYQTNTRVPHNVIGPNPSQFAMENTLKHFPGNKRHHDPINHLNPQAKRFSASPVPNLSIPPNQTAAIHFANDIRQPNNIIRPGQPQINVPNYVSARKLSQNMYQSYSNQIPTHDPTGFNHVPVPNSIFHSNPHTPVEQSEH